MYPYGNLKQLQSKLDEDDQKDFKLDAGANNLILNQYESQHQNAMSTKITKSKSHFLGNDKSNAASDQIDSGTKEHLLEQSAEIESLRQQLNRHKKVSGEIDDFSFVNCCLHSLDAG